MIRSAVLKPGLRRSLFLIIPFALLLGSGCQVARTTTRAPEYHPAKHAEWSMREEIRTSAARHIGTKYSYAGTTPQTGFDCSGFTSYVLGQVDIHLPHQSGLQAQTGEATRVADLKAAGLLDSRLPPGFEVPDPGLGLRGEGEDEELDLDGEDSPDFHVDFMEDEDKKDD